MSRITSDASNTFITCELCDPENPAPFRFLEEPGSPVLCFPHAGKAFCQGDSAEKFRVRPLLVLDGGGHRKA